MMAVSCRTCHATWHGSKAVSLLRSHEQSCMETSTPSLCKFAAYLGIRWDDHGCWIPTQNVTLIGYKGKYLRLPKHVTRLLNETYAHRAMFKIYYSRPATTGLHVAHECGPDSYENGHCVNPTHLHERTSKENHAYMSPVTRSRIAAAGAAASTTKWQKGSTPWNKGRRNNVST